MNKSEREELRRLLRSRFKVLRADVSARQAELERELSDQVTAQYAENDKRYDDALFRIRLAVDEANRKANDIARELWGRERWGERHDRQLVSFVSVPKPNENDKAIATRQGRIAITERVKCALLELERQENELLTELAVSALESAEAKTFFARIPTASELVPAYRLKEIAG